MSTVFELLPVAKTDNGAVAFEPVREANHRIANNLSLVVGSIRIQARAIPAGAASLPAADVRAMLNQIAARVDAVGLLHRALSRQGDGDRIDIGAQLRVVCDALVAAFNEGGETAISYELASCTTSAKHATSISLLVTELVTNAIKYAHPTGIPTAIQVTCGRAANGTLNIAVKDDGVGLPVDLDPGTAESVGLQVVRALAQSLGAKLAFEDSGLGLTVHVRIPA